ncbi:MAG: hypothetical protein EAZ89_20105, partial [Bacteroidetes bacterium]
LRWIGGLAWLQRARFRDVRVMEYAWQNQLNRLATRMGLHKTLLLIESPHISSPMVIGHLRPVILFPVGLITGLSPEQLEAIFVHELAHIRRYDFVVNLVQTWIETIFFYHPASWWISARIRDEREHCCDDIAVAFADPMAYARALTELESRRLAAVQMAPALQGRRKHLLHRIKRLLAPEAQTQNTRSKAMYAVMLLFTLVLMTWISPRVSFAREVIAEGITTSIGILENSLPPFISSPWKKEALPASPEASSAELAEISPLPDLYVTLALNDTPPPAPRAFQVPPVPPVPPVPAVPPVPPFPPMPPIHFQFNGDSTTATFDEEAWEKSRVEWEQAHEKWQADFQKQWEGYGKAWEEFGKQFEKNFEAYNDEENEVEVEVDARRLREMNHRSEEMSHRRLEEMERLRELQHDQMENQREEMRRQQEHMREEMEHVREQAERARVDAGRARAHAEEIRARIETVEKELRRELLRDGLIESERGPLNIKNNGKHLEINGKKLEGQQEEKYRRILERFEEVND